MSFHIRFSSFKHFWFYFILFYYIFRPYQTSGFYPTFLYQYGFPHHSFYLCSFLGLPSPIFFSFIDITIFFYFLAAWFAIWNFDSVQLNLVFWFPFVCFLPYHSFVFRQIASPTGYCADWTGLSLKLRYRNTRHKRDDFLSFASSVSTFVFKWIQTFLYMYMNMRNASVFLYIYTFF